MRRVRVERAVELRVPRPTRLRASAPSAALRPRAPGELSARSFDGVIRRLWGDAEHLDTLRRLETVPGALRHDHEIAGPEASGLLAFLGEEEDGRLPVEDHHDLVGGSMTLPLAVAGPVADEDSTVPIRRQHGEGIGRVVVGGARLAISEEPETGKGACGRHRLWTRWLHRLNVPAVGTASRCVPTAGCGTSISPGE